MTELGFSSSSHMRLSYNNRVAICIANNPVFHKRAKYIEIACQVTLQKVTEDKDNQDKTRDLYKQASELVH